jgi:hypothetical protein
MGLVFRESSNVTPLIIQKGTELLTSSSKRFLESLGFKVQNVRDRKSSRV